MKNSYSNYRHRSLVGEETKWQGYWVTSERFYHIPACHQFGHNRLPQFNSEIQNIHTLFRKSFSLNSAEIESAKMFITGDDLYKLYINSCFVGEGPAQSYPFAYNYNCFDVTDLLKSGVNTISVHIYYQGLFNIYLISADNLCGMIAQLEITYKDGSKQIISSDRSWKYTECEAYSPSYIYGYQTQFSEDIDLNKYPYNWRENDFDDSDWNKVFIQAKPFPMEYNLLPQITPTVSHKKIIPTEIKPLKNGYLFDFGKEITGTLGVFLKGDKDQKVEIRFGEELLPDGRVRYELRANCTYKDTITLTGKEDFVEYFDYKGFRYAEILNPPKDFSPNEVYVLCRHYPFPEKPATFNCSDEAMNKIWDICYNAVKVGTQDTYYDCPTRERGGFLGDAFTTSLAHYCVTADSRILKKFLADCITSSRYYPVISGHIPSYNIATNIEYSVLVPMILENYYKITGDKEIIEDVLPAAEGVWDFYSEFLNCDFLLEGLKHSDKAAKEMQVILIDWPQNLRDDYDFDPAITGEGICTSVNMFMYGFLKSMARLYKIIGNNQKADEFTKLSTKLGNAIIEKTYNKESGLFRDTPYSNHSSLHANALPIYFGLDAPGGYNPIIDMLRQKRLNCNAGFAFFVIEGLFKIGEYELACDLLNGKDEHSWYNMVKEGATALMEAWGADQKWNTSLCHPWGAIPIYFYVSRIFGLRAFDPEALTLEISPYICSELDWANLTLPCKFGEISVSFKRNGDRVEYTVCAPEEISITFKGENIDFKRI